MRINGFRCDACCKEHLIDPDAARVAFFGENMPSEWLIVGRGGKRSIEEPRILCSIKCLRDYAQKIEEVTEP